MKRIVTTSILVGAIFYIGFYTGHKFNNNIPHIKNGLLKKADNINLSNDKNKNKNNGQKNQFVKNNSISEKANSRPMPPHEQEITEIPLLERENQFFLNQEYEVALLEEMLISMKENNFPEAGIEEVKSQLEQLNSAQFIDTIPDLNEPNEYLSAEQMRDNLMNTLNLAGHMTVEEHEQMVYSMFPDEEIVYIDEDETIIQPQGIAN